MARPRLPWIKVWLDMLSDPKIGRLTIAERGCWVGLLLLAGQSPVRGSLMLTETKPMTVRDISAVLKLQVREIGVLKSCITKMEEVGSLRWSDGQCLEVVSFKKRQEVYESDMHRGVVSSALTPHKPGIDSALTATRGERGEERSPPLSPTPVDKGARDKLRAAPLTEPRVKEVLDAVKTHYGYPEKSAIDPIPNYGMEGQAIKRMLTRGFTCDEILACWRSKVSQRGGEFISLRWVNQDIARGGEPDTRKNNKTERGGATPAKKQGARRPGRTPTEEELDQMERDHGFHPDHVCNMGPVKRRQHGDTASSPGGV